MKLSLLNNIKIVKGLIIALVLFIMIVAIKNTFNLSMRYFNLSNQLNKLGNLSGRQIPEQGKAASYLGNIDIEKEVFSLLSQSCQENNVNIKQIQPPKISVDKNIETLTQQVTLQGDFVNILKSLNSIESRLIAIKISSLKFEKQEINKVTELLVQVYFQSVKHK